MMRTTILALISLFGALLANPAQADELAGMGSLSGTVAADTEFQGAKVYARDSNNHVTYMVYTGGGRYNAINMFPGTYEVTAVTPGLTSGTQTVVVESGKTATAALKMGAASGQGAAVGNRLAQDETMLGSYDEIYPAGAGRDTLERTCMKCHGVNWISQRSGLNEAGWDALIDVMTTVDDTVWGVDTGTPMIPPDLLGAEERTELVAYLARNLGPGTPARMVRNDEVIPLDEAELAKAMWVEFTVEEPKAENGEHRWIQEPYFDRQGNVWYTERTSGAPAMLRLDPRTATFDSFPLPNPGWNPHGVVVDPIDGSVWWAGRGVDIARLDPQTGETKTYGDDSDPQRWGGHTPVFDSTGNVWYTMIAADRIGKWDRESDQIKHWDIPTKGGRPYGILADQEDNIWFATFHNCRVTRFDPTTEQFREFESPSQPCSIRRLGLDSKGNVWYGAFSAGMLGVLDPYSGAMKEYRIGRFSEPYEAWIDPEDKVWMADGGLGGMLISFDPDSERFTYYPSPMNSDKPKMAITREGAIWYSNRSIASSGNAPATVGVLYPDMSRMKTLGAYYKESEGRVVGSGSPPPGAK